MHRWMFGKYVPPAPLARVALALAMILVAASPLPAHSAVGPEHSANWFDPERDGEGWSLEILDPQTALGYWFTYDENGHQRWLVGIGHIDGDQIEFPEMLVTSGGRFGPDFDPASVARTAAGSVVMTFADCNAGAYTFEGFGQQLSIPLTRLTRTLSLNCDGDADFPDARAQQSGSWFDPTHDGEGYSLQWLSDGRAVITWFTYDPQGQQFWMIGVGDKVGEELVFKDLISTLGARFGSAFRKEDVVRFNWGELRLGLGCDDAWARYRSTSPDFGSGRFNLRRLTRLAGLICPAEPDYRLANWTLRANEGPRLSELPVVALGDHLYVAGGLTSIRANSNQFWRYQPETRVWTQLANLPAARDHGMMAAFSGQLYFFGGNAQALSNPSRNAWRYDPVSNHWTSIADMPRARAAGGAAVLAGDIYLAGGDIGGLDRYDAETDTWESLAFDDRNSRDHAQVVAHRGELWVLGGRDPDRLNNISAVTIFDPERMEARPGPSMRVARSGFAAVSIGHTLVVAGGEFLGGTTIATVEHFSETGNWEIAAPLPIATHGAGMAALGGRIYMPLGSIVAGGISNPGNVQVFEPSP
ncbi:MAG: hypothetical protein CVV14_01610 [Gammaproteobacteria bacterium HGW-Gammaproteobacteria-4]|jgi:hypothetical protein|nr:MAG: hypothetical protein CVV14_01610 [Gammaproteobacteria bacterium HGW-Gammaproteobacteria-4]